MSELCSKPDFAALILSSSLIAVGLAPTAVAQGLPSCPLTNPDCIGGYLTDNGKYVGEIRHNKKNGQGTETWPDGRKYVGEWKDDLQNGRGTYTWPNGAKYDGEWKNGDINGQGVYTYRNGDKYVGEFKDNQRNGKGTYTARDGSVTSGNWKSGEFVTGIPIEIEGSIFIVPVTLNGKITLDFIIDTGATDVSVPADVVTTLIRTGSITKQDFLGEQQYQLADGSMVPSPIFLIRSLKVGDKIVENVRASVAPVKGSLLLGQSFLNRFNSWSVDNRQRLLFLN